MRPRIKPPRLVQELAIDVWTNVVPHILRRRISTNSSEQIGHCFGISQRPKHILDANATKSRKEIAQVHPQNDASADVRRNERFDRPSFHKSMHVRMGRNFL